jgi:hypothetical protein
VFAERQLNAGNISTQAYLPLLDDEDRFRAVASRVLEASTNTARNR